MFVKSKIFCACSENLWGEEVKAGPPPSPSIGPCRFIHTNPFTLRDHCTKILQFAEEVHGVLWEFSAASCCVKWGAASRQLPHVVSGSVHQGGAGRPAAGRRGALSAPTAACREVPRPALSRCAHSAHMVVCRKRSSRCPDTACV